MADDTRFTNRLLAKVIDQKAERITNDVFLRYAGPDWEAEGYKSMTWSQLAEAVNKAAHWLDENLGKDVNLQSVAYVGPNDARYFFLLVAVMKTSRQVR